MNINATNKRIQELVTKIRDGKLIPNPEFQRRLVWQNKHKQAFLKTVLENYPFPEIYIVLGETDLESGETQEWIVDGQQRITTLYQYFTGSRDLKLGGVVPAYHDLTAEQKQQFLSYTVVVRDLGNLDIDRIKEIFSRINSTGYSLNAMEIHNARYDGEFKDAGFKLSEHSLLDEMKVFAPNTVRRMNDVKFCLNMIITVMSTYPNRDDELEEYLKNYNDEFQDKDKIIANFNQVFDFVKDLGFDQSSRVWNQLDFYTLVVELYKIIINSNAQLDKTKVKSKLDGFYEQVMLAYTDATQDERAREYYRHFNSGPNDRSSRIKRGEIIKEVLLSP